MRSFLVICAFWFGCTLAGMASADFNGTWVVDLTASDSPEPILKRLGASWFQRRLATSLKVEATYRQTKDRLTILTRAPAFSRTEEFWLDGRPVTKKESLTGPYTERTFWSADGARLISISAFRTKDGKDARLRVARQLADKGGTLLLGETLDVAGEPPQPVVRRIWHRKGAAD
ncbi:MAG: hypothetical protein JO015_18395 [Verrucomicrobia bacterium]|nr:hypothetical protein [Verrucomicrobiota bacterium]